MIQTTMNPTMKTAISTILRKAGSAVEPSVTPATNGVAEAKQGREQRRSRCDVALE